MLPEPDMMTQKVEEHALRRLMSPFSRVAMDRWIKGVHVSKESLVSYN